MTTKKLVYSVLGVGILGLAGFFIYQALNSSLVYFIIPSEYAQDQLGPGEYTDKRLRLGGVVEAGSVNFDDSELILAFNVTDGQQSYPVAHQGAPPELFEENSGVVVEGRFQDAVFQSDNVLIKHTEEYEPVAEGQAINVDELKESLQ